MKAWVLESPENLVLQHISIPCIREDEVLVRISAMCLCNGSDPALYRGSEAYRTPYVFGHEAVGVIEQAGEKAADFHAGERVIWWCSTGAFAEYAAVNPSQVAMFHIRPDLPDEQAAILELVIAAGRALMPFENAANGKALRVLGLGPSGLVACAYAKSLGFGYVEGWDLIGERRELALRFGADAVLSPQNKSFDPGVLPKADISLDMAADDPYGDSLTKLCRCAGIGSTIISYGHPIHGRSFSPYVFQSRSLTMRSPENDLAKIRVQGQHLLDLVYSDTIPLQEMISKVKPFGELGQSFHWMLEHPYERLKCIFTF